VTSTGAVSRCCLLSVWHWFVADWANRWFFYWSACWRSRLDCCHCWPSIWAWRRGWCVGRTRADAGVRVEWGASCRVAWVCWGVGKAIWQFPCQVSALHSYAFYFALYSSAIALILSQWTYYEKGVDIFRVHCVLLFSVWGCLGISRYNICSGVHNEQLVECFAAGFRIGPDYDIIKSTSHVTLHTSRRIWVQPSRLSLWAQVWAQLPWFLRIPCREVQS